VDLALGAEDAVRRQVHAQVVEGQQLLGEGGAHPAEHGADAGHELGRRERLGDEVVRTHVRGRAAGRAPRRGR
jgi:hypothetical protein